MNDNIDFPWHFETTSIADTPFELAVASDPDGMLIDACQRQDAGEEGVIDPFWAATWRAAAGMDQYLGRLEITGMPVLELGCGTGHAGIAASIRGADVILTDGVEEPLHLVRQSISGMKNPPKVAVLRFGLDQMPEQQFPLIIGSDVTYLRQLWPDLEQCVDAHLTSGGTWLLSDPHRIIADEFRQWIRDTSRWHYEETSVELADDSKHPIRIMQMKRR